MPDSPAAAPDDTAPASAYQLAQLNIARMRAPVDSPELADFVAGLHPINQLAESAPGFVWRLIGDEEHPDATYDTQVFDPDILVNLSVWEDADTLWDFAYRGPHLDYLRRRGDWFGDLGEGSQVMWWVPAGHRPTEQEAAARLELLRRNGPGPGAFTFRQRYPAPDAQSADAAAAG